MEERPTIETFPNPHPSRDYLIEHRVGEFTSLCPMTGQPDFGKMIIRYVAADLCLELRSLKLYLQSFRKWSQGLARAFRIRRLVSFRRRSCHTAPEVCSVAVTMPPWTSSLNTSVAAGKAA